MGILVFWCHCSSSTNEMYGIRHLWLNLQLPPPTFWCNMGYWKNDNKNYITACEQLVLSITNKLGIQKNDKLLDVGFGCGDSCFFLADHFDCHITGITNEESQWQLAQNRLQQLDGRLQEKIQLYKGSATELNHLFESSIHLKEEKFDHIVSIDSAYHYDTRVEFLNQAYQYLRPGGQLGMWDIILHDDAKIDTPWKLRLWKFIFHFAHVPWANLVYRDHYIQQLEAIGFKGIQLETIPPENNFGNLANHCRKQIKQLKTLQIGNWQTILYLQFSAWVFNYLATHTHLQAVIIKASK
ncbi:unnamed protein product [Cunninghamella echinulata]